MFAGSHASKLGINVLSSHPKRSAAARPAAGPRQSRRRTPQISRSL